MNTEEKILFFERKIVRLNKKINELCFDRDELLEKLNRLRDE